MHSVSDAPHTEQRRFDFPIPANDNRPRRLYILAHGKVPSVMPP